MSGGGLSVWNLRDIASCLSQEDVMQAVRGALVDLWHGRVRCPPPTHLLFDAPRGDCHVKSAQSRDGTHFSIKIATGFYDNPLRGLPVNNGIVVLFDAATGAPAALLQDEGWITSWRTAAAGALAAEVVATPGCTVGIIGSGHQARLQASWISRVLGDPPLRIWGRNRSATANVADELAGRGVRARAASTLPDLLSSSDLIVLCTSSTEPLLRASDLRAGMSVISIGADGVEKSELAPDVFATATRIATDDHAQCLVHGDFGRAVRGGAVPPDADVPLGAVLDGAAPLRTRNDDIIVVTLTGTGAQDLAVAMLVREKRSTASAVAQRVPHLETLV